MGLSNGDKIALAQVAAETVGQAANNYTAARMSAKDRKFAVQMALTQREWALQDWDRTTKYNSPAMQMQRYKEAGLNPNLIYGQMQEAPMVRGTPGAEWHPRQQQWNGGAIVQGFADTQLKAAQTDNLKKAIETADAEISLKRQQVLESIARSGKLAVETSTGKFNLDKAQQLMHWDLQKAELETKRQDQLLRLSEEGNTRSNLLAANSIAQGIQNIIQSRALTDKTREEIKNLQKTGMLQDLDIQLKKIGIQPGDNIIARMVGQLINNPGVYSETISKALEKLKANPQAFIKNYPNLLSLFHL